MIGAAVLMAMALLCVAWIIHDIKAGNHDGTHFGCRDYLNCERGVPTRRMARKLAARKGEPRPRPTWHGLPSNMSEDNEGWPAPPEYEESRDDWHARLTGGQDRRRPDIG